MTVFQQIPLVAVISNAHGVDRYVAASDEGKIVALSLSPLVIVPASCTKWRGQLIP